MTAPTNTVAVTTTDADPTAPTHRISAIPGENTATVKVNINPGNAPLRPGVGVRPGVGLQPGSGAFDVGGALPGEDLTPDMQPYVGAYRMIRAPGTRAAKPLHSIGCVCGLDRCGAPGVKPLRIEAKRVGGRMPTVAPDITTTVTYSELAPAGDGDVTVTVYALVEPEGWV